MNNTTFKYFRDPENFAFKANTRINCSICQKQGKWFNTGFRGINEIECICHECLSNGKLKTLEITSNEAYGGSDKDTEIIEYRTPPLPTWQDIEWPCINGEYYTFERIASKKDFDNKEEFINSFSDEDKEGSDLDWIWCHLAKTIIKKSKMLVTCQYIYLLTKVKSFVLGMLIKQATYFLIIYQVSISTVS